MQTANDAPFRRIPLRSIVLLSIAFMAAYLSFQVLDELTRIIRWVVVAAFFAIVLGPAVDFIVRRTHMRRGLAAGLVFIFGIVVLLAMMYLFIRPLVDQAVEFSNDFPEYVEDARNGEGPAGDLIERYEIDNYIEENQEELEDAITSARGQAIDVARGVASTLAAFLTILVLAFLMLLEGPKMLQSWLQAIDSEQSRERVRRVAADCAKAVTGYMAGNLLISAIAGITASAVLTILGLPFSGVLALWVAFADLIPLVGATLGAVPAVFVAFLDSPTSGVVTLIFFFAYQQFENHVLQVTIMSRTVALNPLLVLISVLVGVELLGIVGALLAIPVGGMLQVIARDLYDHRSGTIKSEPTIGVDEVPISEAEND